MTDVSAVVAATAIDTGDTAWLLTCAALVLLMTPALALFYGGMVRANSVLNMIMMNFGAMAIVAIAWVLFGYSMVFGDDVGGGLLGNPLEFAGLGQLMAPDAVVGTVPALAFVGFQAVFGIITVALISGAIADRARFAAWMVFAALWATLVYFPVAHWVFSFDGVTAPIGRVDRQPARSHRLCRRYCRSHQCRSSRTCIRTRIGQAHWFRISVDAAPQRPTRHAGCRAAVVRVVWFQRWLSSCRQRNSCCRLDQHSYCDRGGMPGVDAG